MRYRFSRLGKCYGALSKRVNTRKMFKKLQVKVIKDRQKNAYNTWRGRFLFED